jgi:transposase
MTNAKFCVYGFRTVIVLPSDAGYQGQAFRKAAAEVLPHFEIEIVRRSDHAKGFEVLSRPWVVERTFAWLNRCRRLAKDFENLTRNALAFLRLASMPNAQKAL